MSCSNLLASSLLIFLSPYFTSLPNDTPSLSILEFMHESENGKKDLGGIPVAYKFLFSLSRPALSEICSSIESPPLLLLFVDSLVTPTKPSSIQSWHLSSVLTHGLKGLHEKISNLVFHLHDNYTTQATCKLA
jgi:hypothetical protein